MQYIFTKKFDGSFTMSWIGHPLSTDEISSQLRDIKTFSITPTKSIKSITKFSDIVRGETDSHYFKKFFSFSNLRSGVTFSDTIPIEDINKEFCPLNLLYLNLSYYRIDTDTSKIPNLSINSIVIEGTYDIEETDEIIEVPDDGFLFTPKDIYKVFKLTGFELYGINTDNLNIQFRFTQDGGRTYTKWEPLTNENISTKKLNPVRFAQVQYGVTKKDNSIVSKVYDIILLGDFQNINNNYLKTNRYGIREDCSNKYPQWDVSGSTSSNSGTTGTNTSPCLSGVTSYKGGGSNYNYNKDWFTQGLSCYLTGNVINQLNNQNNTETSDAGNYDPYSQTKKIGEWYNFLANGSNKILGWTVDYHLNDPDGRGIDRYLHEYQLFNIIDVQKIKVIVPENNFPDNQVQFNDFMLDMMDTFQILILKDEFHRAFGIEKRPAQKDIIFFCQANRFYRVRHAQVHRDIMYMGIYYNVVLEKYEKLANEQNLSSASRSLIEPLTKNNTIDELFGFEMRQQEEKVTNKQLKPTTHEVYKLEVNPKLSIVKKDIYNSLKGTVIANNYYNLSSLPYNTTAVTYTYKDNILEVSDNRAFSLWFNFNNKYDPSKIIDEDVYQSYNISQNVYYDLLNNYDSTNQKGYKIWYSNKQLGITINQYNYYINVSGLTTNVWYSLLINVNNRNRIVDISVYKRNYTYNISMFDSSYKNIIVNSNDLTGLTYYTSVGYRPVKNTEQNIKLENTNLIKVHSGKFEDIPLNSFNFNNTIKVISSDIKMTNLRIFDDIIYEEFASEILIQNAIQDSEHLILADNATRKLYTSNVDNRRWE